MSLPAQTDTLLPEAAERALAPPVYRELTDERRRALTADLDYDDVAPEPEEPTAPRERRAPPSEPSTGTGLLKLLGIVLGLLALVIVLYRLLGDGAELFRRDKKLRGKGLVIDLEDIEDNLEQTELTDYIREATRRGDYRAAVRLYYLDVLKALSARELVRWKRDKTNGEYLRELGAHPLRPAFERATRIYERAWYGRAEPSAAAFAAVEPELRDLVRATRESTSVA